MSFAVIDLRKGRERERKREQEKRERDQRERGAWESLGYMYNLSLHVIHSIKAYEYHQHTLDMTKHPIQIFFWENPYTYIAHVYTNHPCPHLH